MQRAVVAGRASVRPRLLAARTAVTAMAAPKFDISVKQAPDGKLGDCVSGQAGRQRRRRRQAVPASGRAADGLSTLFLHTMLESLSCSQPLAATAFALTASVPARLRPAALLPSCAADAGGKECAVQVRLWCTAGSRFVVTEAPRH